MAYFKPGTPYLTVTSWAARRMRFCQSMPAANSRERWASQMLMVEYGAALANARTAPAHPMASDGASMGAEPVNTWNPGRTSLIIWIHFSRLPELSLIPKILG